MFGPWNNLLQTSFVNDATKPTSKRHKTLFILRRNELEFTSRKLAEPERVQPYPLECKHFLLTLPASEFHSFVLISICLPILSLTENWRVTAYLIFTELLLKVPVMLFIFRSKIQWTGVVICCRVAINCELKFTFQRQRIYLCLWLYGGHSDLFNKTLISCT